ncbi:hypothetical protein EV715DRAFT_198469 [Schizophyllum commune]
MASLKERLAQSGMKVEDVNYSTYIRTSLADCEQFNEVFSSADTYEKISRKTITSQDLISLITDKVENRALVTAHKKGWAKPKESTSKGKKGGKSNGKGKLCPNCQKPGHDTDNCWAPGGGKEHEAPDWYKKKAGKSKNTAPPSLRSRRPSPSNTFTARLVTTTMRTFGRW